MTRHISFVLAFVCFALTSGMGTSTAGPPLEHTKTPSQPASAPAMERRSLARAAARKAPATRKAPTHTNTQVAAVHAALRRVAAIHGAAGPFAVAGYRMGVYAQKHWKLPYGGWQLVVHHHTPARVQWSCVADGLQAATGVSAGKLNLRIHIVKAPKMHTEIVHRKTRQRLRFHLTSSFVKRFLNTPRARLRVAGLQVATLPYTAIFTVQKLGQ